MLGWMKAHRPFVPLGEQECLCHWIRPATAWRLAAHICMSMGSFSPRRMLLAGDSNVCVII